MANWPRFDPNNPQACPVQNQKNRAITDQFEPGSVFKLVTACAALSTGAADLSSVYYAYRGEKSFGSCRIHDCHDGGYGWLDFTTAFAKSSNVCFAQIAEAVGSVPLYAYARDFGFGCPTGISLPGEVRGMLREPSSWSRRSIHTIGIGQESGAPIPVSGEEGGGFMKDKSGGLVISKLNEEVLQKIALITGGSYVHSVTGDIDLEKIYREGIRQEVSRTELKSTRRRRMEERFQWPLLIGIILMAAGEMLGERKNGTSRNFGSRIAIKNTWNGIKTKIIKPKTA